jgi:DNA-directed RNA polymerase subunit RPC12/RpoP
MGYRVLRLHTSHDELAFKTFESKELFDQVYDLLEAARHPEPQVEAEVAPESRDERECPYCAELILRKAKLCKHCGRDVADDPTPMDEQPERIVGTPSASIRVVCRCGAHMKAKLHLAGKNVRCPKCNSPLQVPQI